jgi:SAM-dependent methyltransferase
VDADARAHYEAGVEHERMRTWARLEGVRTLDIFERRLPPAPARVYDVGGGPGFYATRLKARGYDVALLDAVATHVEDARAAGVEAIVGDARELPWGDASADAVLLLGPLYHLTERADRVAALREAARVLRPRGTLVAAAISRYASVLDGMRTEMLRDPAFEAIVARDLADGQHRNPTRHPAWFTTAYFHTPDGLLEEVAEAGFDGTELIGVEGPPLPADVVDAWLEDDAGREILFRSLRRIEGARDLIAASAHFVAIARR